MDNKEQINPPIVWRLQEPSKSVVRDYISCRGYGEMKTVLAFEDWPSNNPEACVRKMEEAFQEFEDGDFILWAGGDPITPFLASIALVNIGVSKANWLRWDRRRNQDGTKSDAGYYVPILLEFDALVNLSLAVDTENFSDITTF